MNIGLIRFIARRFSQSNKRQKFLNFARLVALISVMLGSMALIISLAVLDGFETMLRENAIKFTSHLLISSYNRKPLPNYPAMLDTLRTQFPDVRAVAPVIEREGLIRSKSFVDGILIRGIKPEYDITGMRNNIKEGRFDFSSPDAREIIIGKRLAERLGASVGSNVILYAIRDTGNADFSYPDIDKFRVSGIYETGMAKYDDIVVLIPFQTAASIFKLPPNSTSSYDVMLKDLSRIKEVSRQIEETLGYPYFVLSVFELHSSIFAWIELQKAPIPIVLGLISIVAVLNIITILLVVVVEKTHSIGILRTLGMNNRGILSIFLAQGIGIGLAGTLLGCAIGFAFCWLQQSFGLIKLQGEIYYLDTLPVQISLWHYGIVIGASLVLSFLATLIPSLVAVRIQPIRAIRFK